MVVTKTTMKNIDTGQLKTQNRLRSTNNSDTNEELLKLAKNSQRNHQKEDMTINEEIHSLLIEIEFELQNTPNNKEIVAIVILRVVELLNE